MKISDVLNKDEYSCERDVENVDFSNICTDINNSDEKTLFVLLDSISRDITTIIEYIKVKKPCMILTDRKIGLYLSDTPVLYSENIRKTLALLYSRYYSVDYSKLKIIGVTGTNGKTTTATMLKHILEYSGKKVGFIGTGKIEIGNDIISGPNYSMTTPDPSLLYKSIKEMEISGCEYIVMEVSSHALYFDKTYPINFELSLFTNLSPEHLDFHKDMEEYYNVKMKLFEKSKMGIFNIDDKYSARAYRELKIKKDGIGIIQSAPAEARDIIYHGTDGSDYIYRDTNKLFRVKLKLPGVYNIYNSMMAICAGINLGLKPYMVKEAVNEISSIQGRFEVIKYNSLTVIIDYAHPPEAFKNILKTVNSTKNIGQKVITIFGCGGERDKSKRPVFAELAEKMSDYVIVTSDNSRNEDTTEIIKDILSGFKFHTSRKVITSREKAIENAVISADEDDIIVLIGKGPERYSIDKSGYHYFNEREIIENSMKKRCEIKRQNANRVK